MPTDCLRSLARRSLTAMALAGLCTPAFAQSPAKFWQTWISSLQSQGYGVVQGTAYSANTDYCQAIVYPVFQSCFGIDNSKPYIVLEPPTGAGYVDPYFGAFDYAYTAQGVEVSQAYRVAPTEAIMTIINLPPEGAYFSYQGYLFTRLASLYPGGVQKVSPDPARGVIAASYANSINNIAIQRQSGLTLGQGSIAIISTSNPSLQSALTASFQALGDSPSLLFYDTLGPNLSLGLSSSADDLQGVLRYAVPENAAALQKWLNSLGSNVFTFRIDQPSSVGISQYPPVTENTKAPSTDESSYANSLSELSTLLQGWLAGQQGSATITPAGSTLTTDSTGTVLSGLYGPLCITKGVLCDFDQQDTDAYKIVTLKLAANALVLMAGVNHAVVNPVPPGINNATYISLEANDARYNVGVGQLTQSNPNATGFDVGSFNGSAAQVLMDLGLYAQAQQYPDLIANLPDLYVQIFARACKPSLIYCTRSYTLQIPTLNVTDPQKILERAYVEPGYLNGGNPYYFVNPNAIH